MESFYLKQNESFWETCHKNNIFIINTKYPIKLDFEKIQKIAELHKAHFEFYDNTGEVLKTSYKIPVDPEGKQNPINCFSNCSLLMEGKFYPCTVSPNAHLFNKAFGTAMLIEQEDYLDIYKRYKRFH